MTDAQKFPFTLLKEDRHRKGFTGMLTARQTQMREYIHCEHAHRKKLPIKKISVESILWPCGSYVAKLFEY